ncbi:2OG-Fe(II) oxygenase [Perkinsela sp. CCAP 1560/4]|nr:2OG-Fe(II) oxygenase [Perkinsela sp. CCAP 1560/4]KNH05678.1 2OG-Fe(II) oxygenase [Perkinsela sp. CCAP 1560/4]|eukprot:KNH03946.1 2OG-Fe(II) oxygenase [Perkinsela sp. CCAP 1560/4]
MKNAIHSGPQKRILLVSPSFGGSAIENILSARRGRKFYTFSTLFHRRFLRNHPSFFYAELVQMKKAKHQDFGVAPRNIVPDLTSFDGILGFPGCLVWKKLGALGDTAVIFCPTYKFESAEYQETLSELQRLISICFWLRSLLREAAPLYSLLLELKEEFQRMAKSPETYSKEIRESLSQTNLFLEIDPQDSPLSIQSKLSKALHFELPARAPDFDALPTDVQYLRKIRRELITTIMQMGALGFLLVCCFAFFMYASFVQNARNKQKGEN